MGFGVMNGVIADEVISVFTKENGAGRTAATLKGSGGTENFEGRPRLERIGDNAVAPTIAAEFAVIVGVEKGIVRHGENGTTGRIHDHRHARIDLNQPHQRTNQSGLAAADRAHDA